MLNLDYFQVNLKYQASYIFGMFSTINHYVLSQKIA